MALMVPTLHIFVNMEFGGSHLLACSLADNELSALDGLGACTCLEELTLESNRVSSLVGLCTLTRLRKLALGQNRCVAWPWTLLYARIFV